MALLSASGALRCVRRLQGLDVRHQAGFVRRLRAVGPQQVQQIVRPVLLLRLRVGTGSRERGVSARRADYIGWVVRLRHFGRGTEQRRRHTGRLVAVRRLRRRLGPERHVRLRRGLFSSLLRLHASEKLIEFVGHGGGKLLPLPDAANAWTSGGEREWWCAAARTRRDCSSRLDVWCGGCREEGRMWRRWKDGGGR